MVAALALGSVFDNCPTLLANQLGMLTVSCGPLVSRGVIRGNNFVRQWKCRSLHHVRSKGSNQKMEQGDPLNLTPMEITRLMEIGCKIERNARGEE